MMLIYEDAVVTAHLKEDGAVLGHIVVAPKTPAKTLFELPEDVAVQLWYCASFAATAVYEGLGAHGTNIVCYEGGQGVALHVLMRAEGDGLSLLWDSQRADPAQLESVVSKVKDQLWYVGKEQPSQSTQVVAAKQLPEIPKKLSGPDQRIVHLRRVP